MRTNLFLSALIAWATCSIAQTYQTPPSPIAELADAEIPPILSLNDDATAGILLYRSGYKSIAELNEKEMRLGGLRINPKTNISSRISFQKNIAIFEPSSGKTIPVSGLPENPRIANIQWSPNKEFASFTITTDKGVGLWLLEVKTAKVRRLTPDDLNANMGNPATWKRNSSGLLVTRLPAKRGTLINTEDRVPTGPVISENTAGNEAQNRTYQDLLKNPDDEHNFEVLATAEIWDVPLKGKMKLWRKADMYRSISYSPNGEYVLISSIQRPFSYIVPFSRFPTNHIVYNQNAKEVYVAQKGSLQETLPKGFMATTTEKRSFQWRNDQPATLVWVEALDEGDPKNEVDHRDAIMQCWAPFANKPLVLFQTTLRYSSISWGNDTLAMVNEYWWNTRTARSSFFNPKELNKEPRLHVERNYQDPYTDPGNFVTTRNEFGLSVIKINADTLYLIGEGLSEEGKRPFVDRYVFSQGNTIRWFQVSDDSMLESLVRFTNLEEGEILVRRESSNIFPNYYLRNIKTNELSQLTHFENPFEAFKNVEKRVLSYEREDGLPLTATLYLPAGYDSLGDGKLPMIMWAYPREYKDRASASRKTSQDNQFSYPYYGSPIYWVTRGYAVLDNTAFPIIGEDDEEPNDSFVEQLVGNAKAAIDYVAAMGCIDRKRVAVGGHSYGAFMTANLLTHSDLFAAGIARSGAYNRTLTPFGFQSEQRNYWEAPEVYHTMSPFSTAHKMKTPLLLIHGEADNNAGTYPMQSERYFNALKGLGAPVRLVMLPLESHGYAARESIMHMLWEQDRWLEMHLKP
jgi:dipeptidyl aminopeptidase/acylaminoacyl peptidase